MPEKEFFPYVPLWRGNRARFLTARASDSDAVPEVSVEVHPLSSVEAKAVSRAAVGATMQRKGEKEEEVQARVADVIERESRKVFVQNLRNPAGFKTLSGRELATMEEIWDDAAPQVVQELLAVIEDQSRLEDGLRDRLCSQSDGTPQATKA